MANCDKFVSQYSEYLDGRLSKQIKSEFDQHIHTCRRCAESLRNMRVLKSHLKNLTPVKTSDTFHVVLRSRIRQELIKESIPEKIINYFRFYRWPRYAVAFAVLVLITLFSYNTIFHSEINDQLTSLENESEKTTTTQSTTPSQAVFLVIEQTEKDRLFHKKEKIDSETFQENIQSSTYFDNTNVYQTKPVGVYLTEPSTSTAF